MAHRSGIEAWCELVAVMGVRCEREVERIGGVRCEQVAPKKEKRFRRDVNGWRRKGESIPVDLERDAAIHEKATIVLSRITVTRRHRPT